MAEVDDLLRGRDRSRAAIAAGALDQSSPWPELRDFLDAGMPDWMAQAALERMRYEMRNFGSDNDEVSREWRRFVKNYAAASPQIGNI